MKRGLTNRQCRSYAIACKPFCNGNSTLFGEYVGGLFVTYSYGRHWPLTVTDPATGTVYANASKYGVTTARHQSIVTPYDRVTWDNRDGLERMVQMAQRKAA
jgi:hypothetical protein